MFLDSASQEAIDFFWQACGEVEPFPRSLERSITMALPVALIKLPHLHLRTIENWLHRRKVPFQFNCGDRSVRGCLVAYGGNGFIFVDGTDPADELRFTLAHETAHFIIDYWFPRQKAIQKFGKQICEVFDGIRLPTIRERVHSLLSGTSIGIYTNLMERATEDETMAQIWQIENQADRIALALLAPPEAVWPRVDVSAPLFHQREIAITTVLREDFGLPLSVARSYGKMLLKLIGKGPSWVETLKLE